MRPPPLNGVLQLAVWSAATLVLPWTIESASARPAPSSPVQGAWLHGAPAPSARSEVAAGVVDEKIYLVGGLEEPSPSAVLSVGVSRTVEEYDPILKAWTTKAALPQALHHTAAASIDRYLYAIGGFTRSGPSLWHPVATVYRYDPATDSWIERRSMPTPRGALAVAVLDRHILAIGGFDGARNTAAVERYDPETDTWTVTASRPTPRDHLTAATVGGDACAVGGLINRDYARNLAVVECYHAAPHRWERKADLPAARSGFAAVTLGNRIYAFGGESPQGTIRRADGDAPETDRWLADAGMPTARHGLGAAVVDGRAYVLSGGPTPGASFGQATEIFVPATGKTAPSNGRRASAAQVGAVMAVLATWSEAGVLPPESTPDANRIVKALIQFQAALMKSDHPEVRQFFDRAFERKFGSTWEQHLRQVRAEGWSSRALEAVVEYGADPLRAEEPALETGWRDFNVGSKDLRLLADLHTAAREQFLSEGKDIHAVYEGKRRLMPGAP